MNYLAKRNGSGNWYYRETIPHDVREVLAALSGKSAFEVWRSLGTPDLRQAKEELPSVRAKQHAEWKAIRQAAMPAHAIPTLAELVEAATDYVHQRFIVVQRAGLQRQLEAGLDIGDEVRKRRAKMAQVELLPSAEDMAVMERLAAAICDKQHWALRSGDDDVGNLWRQLVGLVTKAVQLARGDLVTTLEGRTETLDRNQVVSRLGGASYKKAKPGETLNELFELYEAESLKAGKGADTLETEKKVIGHLSDFLGTDRAVAEIGRSDIREFKLALSALPHRWSTRAELHGLGIGKAALKARQLGLPVRASRTVSREISAVSSLFVWLVDNAYVEENPTSGLRPKFDKSKTRYPVYSSAELKAVFSSPLFVGRHAKFEHRRGDTVVRDWRYWVPLCALYSGARAGEIAQLQCADIKQEHGIWVFDFNEDGSDTKSLKTLSSRRIIPVHPVLIELGLLDDLQARLKAGKRALFDLEPGKRGDMSFHPSRFWQRYLTRIELKRPGLALHSFRHTFADECRRNGVDEGVLKALLGHADNSVTGGYGTIALGNLKQRREVIEALSYSGLHDGGLVKQAA